MSLVSILKKKSIPFSGHLAIITAKTNMIISNLKKKSDPYIRTHGAATSFSVSQVYSLPRSITQICSTTSTIHVTLLCRIKFHPWKEKLALWEKHPWLRISSPGCSSLAAKQSVQSVKFFLHLCHHRAQRSSSYQC